MRKILNAIYLLCFLLMLIIPLCLTNTSSNVKSDLDNRVLVELPEIGDSGYEGKIKTYLQDRIGLRNQMMTGYQLLNNYIAGDLTHPSYTYGQDGYIFLQMHNNIVYGNYHKTFAEAVLKMQNYCESRGIKFYILLDPEKASVYRQFLPDGVNYSDEWVDELLAYMQELGINCISNKDLLIARSDKEQVFNHQYDAGHWNDLGCYYGTNHLWSVIHEDFPSVTEYSEEDFDISTNIGRYLPNSKYPVNETIPEFSLKSTWKDITQKFSALKRNKNHPYFRYYENTSPQAKEYPRMLIFHGSYYNRGPEFFVGRSKEYIGIHNYQNVLNLDYYFNIFQPDVVVFEVAEYTFSDGYFDSGKMAGLDYNPSLINGSESIDISIKKAKEQAEEFTIETGSRINLINQDGFDTVYIEKDLSSARYVYILADNKIFDVQKDEYNLYRTGIPHGAIENEATLFYRDYAGKTFFSDIRIQHAISYITDSESIAYTSGTRYDDSEEQYIFTTEIKGNYFDSAGIQLFNATTDEYLGTVLSVQSAGTYRGNIIHKNESGWYLIRFKGNTNKKDEFMDVLTYMVKGEKYYYSFELNKLSKRRIEIKNFDFFGPSPYNFTKEKLIGKIDRSEGTRGTKWSHFRMKTEVEGNVFNSVVLQLRNVDTGELVDPLSVVKEIGVKKGNYYHSASSGKYVLWLRANSNLKDEYIETYVDLEQDNMYEWSFEVQEITPNEVIVKEFSFNRIGTPYE